jgi:hypothetical protein
MDGLTNFAGQSKSVPLGEPFAACASARHTSDKKRAGFEQRQEQILRFPVGSFSVVNAGHNIQPSAQCTVAQDIMLTMMPCAAGKVKIDGVDNEGHLRGGAVAFVRVLSEDSLVLLGYDASEMPDQVPNIIVRKLVTTPEWTTLGDTDLGTAEQLCETIDNIQVHFEKRGDVNGSEGDWIGNLDNPLGIEGFSISPKTGLTDKDIAYRAIFGACWESPWYSSGTYCGSRGLDLPINGFVIRLSEEAEALYQLSYSGLFRDGTVIGPVDADERCATVDFQELIGLFVKVKKRAV